jgi:hypothetical protein
MGKGYRTGLRADVGDHGGVSIPKITVGKSLAPAGFIPVSYNGQPTASRCPFYFFR